MKENNRNERYHIPSFHTRVEKAFRILSEPSFERLEENVDLCTFLVYLTKNFSPFVLRSS